MLQRCLTHMDGIKGSSLWDEKQDEICSKFSHVPQMKKHKVTKMPFFVLLFNTSIGWMSSELQCMLRGFNILYSCFDFYRSETNVALEITDGIWTHSLDLILTGHPNWYVYFKIILFFL